MRKTPKILIIEPRTEGHFPSYVELAIKAVEGECILATGKSAPSTSDFKRRVIDVWGNHFPENKLGTFDWSNPTRSWFRMLPENNQLINSHKPDLIYVPSSEHLERRLVGIGRDQKTFRIMCRSIPLVLGKPITAPAGRHGGMKNYMQRVLSNALENYAATLRSIFRDALNVSDSQDAPPKKWEWVLNEEKS